MTNDCIINPELYNLLISKKEITYSKTFMKNWEITILKEDDNGYLLSAPNGDTQWVSKEDYQKYLEKKKGNSN